MSVCYYFFLLAFFLLTPVTIVADEIQSSVVKNSVNDTSHWLQLAGNAFYWSVLAADQYAAPILLKEEDVSEQSVLLSAPLEDTYILDRGRVLDELRTGQQLLVQQEPEPSSDEISSKENHNGYSDWVTNPDQSIGSLLATGASGLPEKLADVSQMTRRNTESSPTGKENIKASIVLKSPGRENRSQVARKHTVTATKEPNHLIELKVVEAFTNGTKLLSGATANIIGSKDSLLQFTSDEWGVLQVPFTPLIGVLPLRISKNGYAPRIVNMSAGRQVIVELVSYEVIKRTRLQNGLGDNIEQSRGFVFGELYDPENRSLSGHLVKAYSLDRENEQYYATYLSNEGSIDLTKQVTTERGQFMFLDLPQGTYLVQAVDEKGTERAPITFSISSGEAIVKRFSLGNKMRLSGQVFAGFTREISVNNVRVSILGHRTSTMTDENGQFHLSDLYLDCNEENIILLDKQKYYRNSMRAVCAQENILKLYPRSYIDALIVMSEMPPKENRGILLGRVTSQHQENAMSKVQLVSPFELDKNESFDSFDFYFDRDGELDPTQEIAEKNGQYSFINAPAGREYLEVLSASGSTLGFEPTIILPNTIHVQEYQLKEQ